MSIRCFDDALDFMPRESNAGGRARSSRGVVRDVLSALRAGLEAEQRYRVLAARGVQPAEAARRALTTVVAD